MMLIRVIGIALLVLTTTVGSSTLAGEHPRYIGEWSNGRGETLEIRAKTIQFGGDKAIAYRDITRATDGNSFQLQITAAGEINAFAGKFLYVECDGDEMTIRQFRTAGNLVSDTNPVGEVTWSRDSDE